jgi:hydrogenase small subunit
LFGDVSNASWPVGTGHPCIGCTEKGIGFEKPIHALAELKTVSPPTQFARPAEEQGVAVSFAAAAALAAIAGAAAAGTAMLAKNLGKSDELRESDEKSEPGAK